jgi:hypothetical protein
MPACLTPESIKEALSINVWDFANRVLYDLCKQNPDHKRDDVIIAKIWLIGRAYAAAIERRRIAGRTLGDAFYEKKVASTIRNSHIDAWFSALDASPNEDLATTLETHKRVMDLFRRISGLEKRSLASKYLHFHFPTRFYIYDSRAYKAICRFTGRVGRRLPRLRKHDNVYARFYIRCEKLRREISSLSDAPLAPRDIDKILLYTAR